VKSWLHEIKLHCSDLSGRPTPSWRYWCSNSACLGSWAMVFGSNNRWVPRDFCVTVHLHLNTSLNIKADISNWFLVFLMMIWDQQDWRVPNSVSTSFRYKRDAIFEI
jgi:hypothetical protein